jgi:formylglycine-generating enzyme required for sulfatase activity
MANYSGVSHPWSGSTPRTTPVGYYNGDQQGGGADMANGYGLYDMAGNIWEWCWDRHQSNPSGDNNPTGPDTGSSRLLRGGSWGTTATDLRCAYRFNYSPSSTYIFYGFRCARGL